ncbi:MAG: xanthine dehydrogenase family protein subunit M [Caldisericia bacterium]|nr:xanthine dehydrogenase family protein subunit M [Caldisericia bacterium]
MKEFEYLKPRDLNEALLFAREYGHRKRFLAGGTDLIVRLKDNLIREDYIIDIGEIEELRGIEKKNGEIHIGPITTHSEIIESEITKKYAPLLVEAVKTIGSPQIRNRGTIGGNICNASPAGDSIPALVVSEARFVVKSLNNERIIDIKDFFVGPGKTSLKQDEILYKIIIPEWKENEIGFFNKLGQRNAMSISIASVAVKLEREKDNKFKKAFVSFGAVSPVVNRATKCENLLTERELDSKDYIFEAANCALDEVNPITDVRATREYRREVSKYLLYESLLNLLGIGG